MRATKARKNWLVIAVAVGGLVLSSAAPAAAEDEATVGAGAGTGWEYAPDEDFCGLPTSGASYPYDEFVLEHQATFTSVDSENPGVPIVEYVGDATIEIETGPVTQAPQGAADGECPAPILIPGLVDLTSVTVDGSGDIYATNPITGDQILVSDAGGSISCEGDDGDYLRVNTTVVFTFTATCTITGNVLPGEIGPVDMQFVVEGNQTPCFIPIVNPFPPLATETGVDNPICIPEPNASSHMVTTFEAVGTNP